MKITIIVPNKNIGGGTRVVTQYSNRLVSRGHDVTLIHTQIPPYIGDLIRSKGFRTLVGKLFEVQSFKANVSWPVKGNIQSVPSLSIGIQRLWHNRIPDSDAVIAASWRVVPAVSRLPESKGVKCHLVQDYEVWDLWNSDICWQQAQESADDPTDVCLEMYGTVPERRHVRRQKRLVDGALNRPVEKITVSPWLSELIEQRIGYDVAATVPNGIDTDLFYPQSNSLDYFRNNNTITVLAPYRTPKYKGLSTLLESFRQVRKRYDIPLYFYGPPPEKNLPDWSTHVGMIPDDELRRLYSAADIFVSPSHAEGWGLPSTEAAACRTAVVSTENGWVRDYADQDTVLKVPPRDATALAEGIIKLIENPDRRRTLARRAHDLVSNQFTVEQSTDKLEQALQSIT